MLGEQRGGGHEEAWRAEPALDGAVADEGVLQRRQAALGGEPLHRLDGGTAGAGGEGEARAREPTVDEDRAGAARPLAAALLGPEQVEPVAQHFQERPVRGHFHAHGAAVHREGQRDAFHHARPDSAARPVSTRRVHTRSMSRRYPALPCRSSTGSTSAAAASAARSALDWSSADPSRAAAARVSATGLAATPPTPRRALTHIPSATPTTAARPTSALSSRARGVHLR